VGVSARPGLPAATRAPSPLAEVVWHDLECGGYRADLPLWRELAARHPGPILEVGAGSGRVALDLAQAGHRVTALEREPALLDALRARAGARSVQTICADARSARLPERHFALCLVPMHTIQLFGGATGRASFLRNARAALRRGGLLACALLADVEAFALAPGEAGPDPETALIDGTLYVSRPTRVAVGRQSVVIERERSVLAASETERGAHRDSAAPATRLTERSVVELQRLVPRNLEREARSAGLRVEPAREVPATEDHGGSTVVMLRG
jgi:SAM-dependent methyltransferase